MGCCRRYYHFHVHFQHACMPGTPGTAVGKAHLLDDVIGRSPAPPSPRTRSGSAAACLAALCTPPPHPCVRAFSRRSQGRLPERFASRPVKIPVSFMNDWGPALGKCSFLRFQKLPAFCERVALPPTAQINCFGMPMQLNFCPMHRTCTQTHSLTHEFWTADNIATFGSDFYQRCTLTYSIGTRDPLLECFTKRKPVHETVAA